MVNIYIFRNKFTLVVEMDASNDQSESDSAYSEVVSSTSTGDKAPGEHDTTTTSSVCQEKSSWNLLPRNFSSWQFFEVIN